MDLRRDAAAAVVESALRCRKQMGNVNGSQPINACLLLLGDVLSTVAVQT
jgi:hypothetical protein